jgi:hypothetical protein
MLVLVDVDGEEHETITNLHKATEINAAFGVTTPSVEIDVDGLVVLPVQLRELGSDCTHPRVLLGLGPDLGSTLVRWEHVGKTVGTVHVVFGIAELSTSGVVVEMALARPGPVAIGALAPLAAVLADAGSITFATLVPLASVPTDVGSITFATLVPLASVLTDAGSITFATLVPLASVLANAGSTTFGTLVPLASVWTDNVSPFVPDHARSAQQQRRVVAVLNRRFLCC